MKRRSYGYSCLLGLAFLVAWAAKAPAQPVAEAPKLNVGDEWTWNSVAAGVFSVKVVGFEGESTITTSTHSIRCGSAGCRQVRDRNLTILQSTGRHDLVGAKVLDFPLSVGKTWDYRREFISTRDGRQYYTDASCRVVAVEPVTVPAGRFDEAYKIHCDLSIRTPFSWRGETMSWYAPKAKIAVKVSDLSRNFAEKPDFELTAYKLQD